jgi:hypothetical protein
VASSSSFAMPGCRPRQQSRCCSLSSHCVQAQHLALSTHDRGRRRSPASLGVARPRPALASPRSLSATLSSASITRFFRASARMSSSMCNSTSALGCAFLSALYSIQCCAVYLRASSVLGQRVRPRGVCKSPCAHRELTRRSTGPAVQVFYLAKADGGRPVKFVLLGHAQDSGAYSCTGGACDDQHSLVAGDR